MSIREKNCSYKTVRCTKLGWLCVMKLTEIIDWEENVTGFSVKNIAGCTGKRATGPLRQYLEIFRVRCFMNVP
jgi:hypothetical protein